MEDAAAAATSSSSSKKKRKLPSWVNLHYAQKFPNRNENRKVKRTKVIILQSPTPDPLLLVGGHTKQMITPEQIKPRTDDDRKPVPFFDPDVDGRSIKPSVRIFDMEISGAFSTVKSREEANSETRSVSHLEHPQYIDADQASDSSKTRIRSKRLLPASLLTINPSASVLKTKEPSPHPPWNMLKILDSLVFKEESSPPEGLMSISLLKHQRITLAWMEKMENKLNGGILADEQELGKTIEIMALLLKEKPIRQQGLKQHQRELIIRTTIHRQTNVDSLMGGTLIVCPTSVLKQWEQEIKGKITEAAGFSILVYHGSNRIKDPLELANHDIVLTTYAIIAMEAPTQPLCGNNLQNSDCNGGIATLRKTYLKERSKGTSSGHVPLRNSRGGSLYKVFWFRIVLDEAQNIKNPRTRIANACWMLKAERR